MCKWSLDVQERIHRDYLGESPLINLLPLSTSDPENQQQSYLNAEPDIQTIHVQPDDFLIMASKDVWDSLSNEEVVGLVGIWLERKHYNLRAPISHPSPENFFGHDMLPVKFPEGWEDTTTWYKRMKIQKRFICIDSNVAVHLIRNALGGANQGFTEGVLRLPQPLATNSRCVVESMAV
jgi:pyruvate dehydrogenase phosphatase